MKFEVRDLEGKLIHEFSSEYEMDRWLVEQVTANKLRIGKFCTRVTQSGKAKVAEVEEDKKD